MFQPIRTDPPPDQVRRIIFVPFLADGQCVLIDEPGDPALSSGEVLDGEHYLLDTVLRVPLQTAGFRGVRHCRRPLPMVVISVRAAGIMTVK